MRFAPFFLVFSLLVTFVRADVRIVGSDLLGAKFTEGVTAYSKRNDLGVQFNLEGSRAGLERLTAGRADLGLMVFGPGEKPPGEPFVAVTVAYHTVAVVVPASVPVTQITFSQLNAIYADDAQSGVRRWNDLGVTGEWAHRNILPNIPGAGGGITFDLFRHTVLRAPALKPTVAVQTGLAETLTRIRGEEGGMAIMPFLPANQPRLKTLLVARGAQDVAFGPTPENIHSGDYPIRLAVQMVFRKEDAKRLQPVLRYLLSEEAVPVWESVYLVPLPIQARNQQIFDLEVL